MALYISNYFSRSVLRDFNIVVRSRKGTLFPSIAAFHFHFHGIPICNDGDPAAEIRPQ
jgi:hypothetical protein